MTYIILRNIRLRIDAMRDVRDWLLQLTQKCANDDKTAARNISFIATFILFYFTPVDGFIRDMGHLHAIYSFMELSFWNYGQACDKKTERLIDGRTNTEGAIAIRNDLLHGGTIIT